MNTSLLRLALPLLLTLLFTQRLSAHFLFVHVVHGAEPRIELHFAESAWDFSANPGMVTILERVKASLPNGEAIQFERRPFGLVAKLSPGQVTAAASLTYGLIARGGDPFLLEYHAKGAIGLAEAGTSSGLLAEVLAEEKTPGNTTLTVMFRGKPAAGAEVVVPLEGTITEKMSTDANGQLVIPTPKTPLFAIRAMVAETRNGTHDEKPYSLVKHYTTLTVHPSNVPDNCDGIAWAILQDAGSCCGAFVPSDKQWQAKFRLSGVGARAAGTLRGTAASVQMTEAPAQRPAALTGQLRMLGCFADPRRLNGAAVRFAKDRGATLEAHIEVPALQLAYVIRDRHIETIRRTGDAGSERVDVISWKMTHDERVLPQHLVVTRFSHDGRLTATTMMKRTYQEVQGGYLLDRQDCNTVQSPDASVRSSLRLSEAQVVEAAGR